MQDLEQRRFRLHARADGYQRRIERAGTYIERIDERFDAPSLHVSGGKDSLVLWHLMHESAIEWPVFHFDNGLLNVPGVTEFVRHLADEWESQLYVRSSEAVNDERMLLEEGHGYNGYWGTYERLARKQHWDCRVLGIRAAESPQRRDRFDGLRIPTDTSHDPAAAPIHHLKTADVWAYIVDHDLDYHEIYDEQGELYDGIDSRENRLVTLYDSEFDSLGSQEISQFIYPGETNELKDIEQRK
ncbi:phosphoadenosine phosphosulfate reductase family protein [Halovenus sp. HT40]|uniref:phosphoadenosine phosphosulfate reductase family protein n=1 Tax=Halovenus sp. HT40 TaxID=3126691 RepID=UPI00300F61CB